MSEARHYKPGQVIVEQGEPAMEAFLIEAGSAVVTFEKGGKHQRLATLEAGEIFGETALFKGSDYGATVTADSDCQVIPITPDILDAKINACDPMIRALIRMMMVRLRKANEALAS